MYGTNSRNATKHTHEEGPCQDAIKMNIKMDIKSHTHLRECNEI